MRAALPAALPAALLLAGLAAPAAAHDFVPGPYVHTPSGTYVQFYDPRTGVPVGGPVAVSPHEFHRRAMRVPAGAPHIEVRPRAVTYDLGLEPAYAPAPRRRFVEDLPPEPVYRAPRRMVREDRPARRMAAVERYEPGPRVIYGSRRVREERVEPRYAPLYRERQSERRVIGPRRQPERFEERRRDERGEPRRAERAESRPVRRAAEARSGGRSIEDMWDPSGRGRRAAPTPAERPRDGRPPQR